MCVCAAGPSKNSFGNNLTKHSLIFNNHKLSNTCKTQQGSSIARYFLAKFRIHLINHSLIPCKFAERRHITAASGQAEAGQVQSKAEQIMAPGTVVLGKRKRRVPTDKAADVDAKPDRSAATEEAQAIFRKHFEAQFAPLEGSDGEASRPAAKGRRKGVAGRGADGDREDAAGVEDMRSETSDSGEDDESQDEWDGLSTEGDDDGDSQGGW